MSEQNPYAPPTAFPPQTPSDPAPIDLALVDQRKIEDVIRESRNFHWVLLLSIVCIPLAGIFIPIWYLLHLWQWQSLAQKYPALLVAGLPKYSIQTRFKSCRWKLVASFIVGIVNLGLMLLVVLDRIFKIFFFSNG